MAKRHIDYFNDLILKKNNSGGGGQSVTVEALSVTENGTYTAESGKAFSPVSVAVPVPVLDSLQVNQNGNYTPASGHAYNAVSVNVPSSGGEPEWKEVTFIDYDGTILHSYTAQEFLAMTAMPANPEPPNDHTRAAGWNWTLADAKTYVQAYGRLVIGQLYNPTSYSEPHYDEEIYYDCLYITIDITADLPAFRTVTLTGLAITGEPDFSEASPKIFWGDGSQSSSFQHTYNANGKYTIKVCIPEGMTCVPSKPFGIAAQDDFITMLEFPACVTEIGNLSGMRHLRAVTIHPNNTFGANVTMSGCPQLTGIVLPAQATTISLPKSTFFDCTALRFASLGLHCAQTASAGQSLFNSCTSLKEICLTVPSGGGGYVRNLTVSGCTELEYAVVPNEYTFIGDNAFKDCRELKRIYGMGGITTLGKTAFTGCYSLQHLDIPEGVTAIPQNCFGNNHDLETLTLPSTLTSIASGGLACGGVLEYHFKSTTPPTLTSSSSISGNTQLSGNDWKIYVPASAVSTYKGASNWSDHASRIFAEPTT